MVVAVSKGATYDFPVLYDRGDGIPDDGYEKIGEGEKYPSERYSQHRGPLEAQKKSVLERRDDHEDKGYDDQDVPSKPCPCSHFGWVGLIEHGELDMPFPAHCIAGTEYYCPAEPYDDGILCPGEGMIDHIPKKYL